MESPESRGTEEARMNEPVFGKLEKVDPKTVWKTLADEFTPWLAQDHSLAQLGEEIGLELARAEAEQVNGAFEADIVCKDSATQGWVLIENQVEEDYHRPLGRMVANAAESPGATFVWISSGFSDKSQSILAWLNHITGSAYRFFGVEIELWRIGQSSFAPRFNAVCRPESAASSDLAGPVAELSDAERQHLEYWTALCELLKTEDGPFKVTRPQPHSQMSLSIGPPGFVLIAFIDAAEKRVGIYLQLSGPSAKANLHILHSQKAAIETEIISPLEWRELPDKQEGYIMIRWEGADPNDRSAWAEQHEWLRETLLAFHRVFADRVKDLDASKEAYEELPWE
jgi:hypothetical protein